MLPIGHIAYTWAALSWLRSRGLATDVDYRGAAVASLLPDLIDKPLTLTLMSGSGTSQGPSHTLLGQAMLTIAAAQLKPEWLPYALVVNSHLFFDQMWKYPRTLLFPFSGRFDSWRYMGTPSAMLDAYAEIATRPAIVAVEVIGLVLLGVLVQRHRLYEKNSLKRFLLTGKPSHGQGAGIAQDAQPNTMEAGSCA
jgi:hypothetical protein